MTRWFRHYAGMARDDKLVRIALRSKQPIERVVWVWSAILESAAERNDAGLYEIDVAEIAYFLRADEADIGAIANAFADAGHVAAGAVVKWGDRQFQSDSSAERQARYRARKRGPIGGVGDQECNKVTVTSRHGDGPDTETDTEPPKPPKVGRRGRMTSSKVLMALAEEMKEATE